MIEFVKGTFSSFDLFGRLGNADDLFVVYQVGKLISYPNAF